MTATKRVSSPQSRRSRACIVATLLIALLGGWRSAGATTSCTLGVGNIQAALPTGTYTVPRDAPTPSLISGFTSFNPADVNLLSCSHAISTWSPPKLWVGMVADGGPIVVGGKQSCNVQANDVDLLAASSSVLSHPGDTVAGAAFSITLSNRPSGLSNSR